MDTEKFKKVLILCYDFPPYNSVGGQRPYSWFKYFKKFNIHPVVITRHWDRTIINPISYVKPSNTQTVEKEEDELGTIIRVPYKPNIRDRFILKYGLIKFPLIRKSLSFYLSIARFLWSRLDNTSNIHKEAGKYLKENGCDLIIATGEPFILFKYASELSRHFKIPFIADYRDGWTTNYSNNYTSGINKFIIRHFFQRLEKHYIKNAAVITTVSPAYQRDIQLLHPKKDVHVIFNGYDLDYPEFTADVPQNDSSFQITYAGTIYPYQQLELFLEGYKNFIQITKCKNSEVIFYGLAFYPDQVNRLYNYNAEVNEYLATTERISHPEVIRKLQESSVLLLLADDRVDGSCAKIFEYLALERKIMLVKDDKGTLSKIMDKCEGGIRCSTVEEVTASLIELYEEHLKNGYVSHISDNYTEYSRRAQCEGLSIIIQKHIANSRSRNGIQSTDAIIKTDLVYKQCTRCVMDTTDPEIHFDINGRCNHCNEFFENTSMRTYQGTSSDQKLDLLVKEIKKSGRNKEYDCVLGLSGGIDSCYAAYILKNLGLRTLAVHLDNGWDSEISVKNVKYIVSKLGFGYESYVLDWEEFRDLQLAFLKASVPEAETPTDIAIPAILHEIAAKNNIKHIISGGNFATEGILPKSWHYDAKDVKYLKSIHKQFGKKKLKTFPTFGFQKEMYYKFIKGIKTIYLLNYVPYGKQEAMKVLEMELAWKYYGGKHYESKYTGFLQSYILPEKFNLDYRRATLSTQICAGEITREDALKELLNDPYDPVKAEEEKQYVCKKLDISLEEFNKIMNLAPKTYNDYPNSQKMLEFIYGVYRKLYDMN